VLGGENQAATDDADTPPLAIINEELARRYWPGQNPIGKRLAINNYLANSRQAVPPRFREVVGVVGNVRQRSVELPAQPAIYTPFLQDETNRVFVLYELVCAQCGRPAMVGG